jgi:hypothetical protein
LSSFLAPPEARTLSEEVPNTTDSNIGVDGVWPKAIRQ